MWASAAGRTNKWTEDWEDLTMRKETVHYKRSSRAGRKASALLLSCLMAFAALPLPRWRRRTVARPLRRIRPPSANQLEDNTLSGTPEIGGLPGETDGEPIDAPRAHGGGGLHLRQRPRTYHCGGRAPRHVRRYLRRRKIRRFSLTAKPPPDLFGLHRLRRRQ